MRTQASRDNGHPPWQRMRLGMERNSSSQAERRKSLASILRATRGSVFSKLKVRVLRPTAKRLKMVVRLLRPGNPENGVQAENGI